VEILLNLVWVSLSAALSVFWLLRRAPDAGDGHSVSLKTQLVSLAVVFLILLPVVSLTDDLQAFIAPAEVEHACRRGDALPGHDAQPESQFAIVSIWLVVLHSPNPIAIGGAEQTTAQLHPHSGFTRAFQSRPPPSVA